MIEYLAAQFGLGLAGFDPIGALIVAGALAAGASRRDALAFAASCLVFTVGAGAGLSYALGPLVTQLSGLLDFPDPWWVAIELGVAAVLLAWAVRRLRNRPERAAGPPKQSRGAGLVGMTVSGGLWGLAAATDPTFYASALLAGRRGHALPMAVGILTWYAVSQLPLHLLTVAVIAGRHGRATEWIKAQTERWAAPTRRLVTALLLAGAAFLVADTTAYLITGRFLVGDA